MYALFPILEQRRRQPGGTLSGGEQQMLAIARGIDVVPPPVAARRTEPRARARRRAIAVRHDRPPSADTGVTVFIVEQDIRSTLEIADSAYVLENGRIVMLR